MAIRVVTEDAPIIRITGVASAPVSSPIGAVNTVNVSQSNQIVKVPSTSAASIEIKPIGSAEVQVNSPIVRPFKAIIYQGPKGDPGDPGVSGDGSSFLTEELTVTNPVGEAEDGKVYPQLTDLEDIVRDMLTVNVEPDPIINFARFGKYENGVFTEYQDHGNKFEIGDTLHLDSVTLTTTNLDNMYPDSAVKVRITNPSNEPHFVLAGVLPYPSVGWENFVHGDDIVVDVSQSPNSYYNLNYETVGKKVIKTNYLWLDGPIYSPSSEEVGNREIEFFIGKKIRCFTSEAKNPGGTNLGLSGDANVYDPDQAILLAVAGGGENEDQYTEVITDFTSETREVIITFDKNATYPVSSTDRYLIIEVPNEFSVDEVAATTAGSGIYSLNDSIVYLGNQFPSGDPYTRNGIEVKYYGTRQKGAFDNKIKIDLQLKLDN